MISGLATVAAVERFCGVEKGTVRSWDLIVDGLFVRIPGQNRPILKVNLRKLWQMLDPKKQSWRDYEEFVADFHTLGKLAKSERKEKSPV